MRIALAMDARPDNASQDLGFLTVPLDSAPWQAVRGAGEGALLGAAQEVHADARARGDFLVKRLKRQRM